MFFYVYISQHRYLCLKIVNHIVKQVPLKNGTLLHEKIISGNYQTWC